MARRLEIIATIAVVGALGGLAIVNRDDAAVDESPKPIVAAAAKTEVAAPIHAEAPPVEEATAPIGTPDVGRWITDSQSNDSRIRAVAIEALANAPKAQALPALERVLESGEPQVDRQIALRSLHRLALNDGDDNGAIRDVIRHAMYHSDDESVTQSAQAFLEDIEAALDERTQPR